MFTDSYFIYYYLLTRTRNYQLFIYLSFYLFGKLFITRVCLTCMFFLLFPPVPCPSGSFSPTGLAPCTLCNRRSFQPHNESRICVPCPGTTATVLPGSKSPQDCIGKWHETPLGTNSAARPLKGHYAGLNIVSAEDRQLKM